MYRILLGSPAKRCLRSHISYALSYYKTPASIYTLTPLLLPFPSPTTHSLYHQHTSTPAHMKLQASTITLTLALLTTSVHASFCCFYGAPGTCLKRALSPSPSSSSTEGVIYVRENGWVPAVRGQYDIVVGGRAELGARSACCCPSDKPADCESDCGRAP